MFVPVGDDNRDRKITPFINYLLIIANILVFVFLQTDEKITYTYSTVPIEILTGQDIAGAFGFPNPITRATEYITLGHSSLPVYFTLVTSMFLHGGWAHLLGNMLYLWICGDNIENDMGHFRYLAFYLLCGIIAGLSHVFSSYYFGQNLYIPSLGASGAISGVLGAYLLMHPRRRMHVWILFGIISLPALVVVGLWFVFQVINSMGTLGGNEEASIAYAAHIGGFVAGLIFAKLFAKRKPALVEERKSFW